MENLDFDAVYSCKGFRGVAVTIYGYPKVWVPYTFFATDDEGNEYEDTDPTEGDWEDDIESGRVVVVMVGDDRKHTVDVSDLTKINEDDYCDGCGQIRCGHFI